ncbi:hypothetical protein JX265_009653 [Neoarthrinium moseri]|uniref:Pre-rRNA-processing protein RIX1 n=1 Tax=Neoarthrinium moseri TaxID=1658444 RepID=A0A9Q0AM98_9PEZI|nr:hypothetical protein JX265_009653 [Neoarthrinium moseri]
MAFVALPPELRSICRKLTAYKPEQLPGLLPALLKDLQRCQGPLSAPQESKSNANSSEAGVLVHKLRTHIGTLLNGRSVEGRFAAVALVKAYTEVGGWECLRTSEAWVRGLLSILQVSLGAVPMPAHRLTSQQKKDPAVTKELAIVTLTKIYLLLNRYQTLIREIVTPTLPTFASACLQILKPPSSSKAGKAPLGLTETIFEALSSLIPLYPTTLRPSASQIRSVTRPYLAPTNSDETIVPQSLKSSAQRLVIRLHMTAAKNGGSEEWAKHTAALIKDFHETADQVFRAVQETWESATGHSRQPVDYNTEPCGGGSSAEQLPEWTGLQAGSERMVGLLQCLASCLQCATKVPVTVPVSALADLAARVSSIVPPHPGQDKDASIQLNPAVGREEKDELWTVFPEIQIATMRLLQALARRLGSNYTPLAQDTLDQTMRIIEGGYRFPEVRLAAFALTTELLQLCGPTMSKANVDALSLVAMTCCRDLLGAAGHIKAPKQQQASSAGQNGAKSRNTAQNADAFLSSNIEEESVAVTLAPEHLAAAEKFLVTLFSHLPQHYLNPELRSRMLRAAILCSIKDAQVASILHPSKDKNGRTPQVILPYLHQQFPHDETVEILRFSFRPASTGARGDLMDLDDEEMMTMQTGNAASSDKPRNGLAFDRPFQPTAAPAAQDGADEPVVARTAPPVPGIAAETAPSPFISEPGADTNPLKRKNDNDDVEMVISPKRISIDDESAGGLDPGFGAMGTLVESTLATVPAPRPEAQGGFGAGGDAEAGDGSDDDDDDESVHLNMDLDSDGDEGDEDES